MDSLKQVGALPIRKTAGGIEVLLVTTRETRRWVIPKGWPSKRMPDHKAAAREALEEAGVQGEIKRKPVGSYTYFKRLTATFELIEVDVYLLAVDTERKRWPEMHERQKSWMKPALAARAVAEPGLAALIGSIGRTLTLTSKLKLKRIRKADSKPEAAKSGKAAKKVADKPGKKKHKKKS